MVSGLNVVLSNELEHGLSELIAGELSTRTDNEPFRVGPLGEPALVVVPYSLCVLFADPLSTVERGDNGEAEKFSPIVCLVPRETTVTDPHVEHHEVTLEVTVLDAVDGEHVLSADSHVGGDVVSDLSGQLLDHPATGVEPTVDATSVSVTVAVDRGVLPVHLLGDDHVYPRESVSDLLYGGNLVVVGARP